jgi:hypothetical protein
VGALKFYVAASGHPPHRDLKEGTEAVGNRVRVKVVKNKVAAPFRQAEFDIEFGKGFSTSGCLIDLGIEHNVVTVGLVLLLRRAPSARGRNNARRTSTSTSRSPRDRGQDLRGAGHRSRPRPADRSRRRRRARRRAGDDAAPAPIEQAA